MVVMKYSQDSTLKTSSVLILRLVDLRSTAVIKLGLAAKYAGFLRGKFSVGFNGATPELRRGVEPAATPSSRSHPRRRRRGVPQTPVRGGLRSTNWDLILASRVSAGPLTRRKPLHVRPSLRQIFLLSTLEGVLLATRIHPIMSSSAALRDQLEAAATMEADRVDVARNISCSAKTSRSSATFGFSQLHPSIRADGYQFRPDQHTVDICWQTPPIARSRHEGTLRDATHGGQSFTASRGAQRYLAQRSTFVVGVVDVNHAA